MLFVVPVTFAAAATSLADAAGGLVVVGAGWGVTWDAAESCPNHPFAASVHFLPGQHAIVNFQYPGGSECPLWTGGKIVIGRLDFDTTKRPPVSVTFYCNGSETAGVYCFDGVVTVTVSPYQGPGVMMLLTKRGGDSNFDGLFMPA